MGIEVRTATMADIAGIRRLWKLCFGDSEAFMDWYFSERFFPELTSCLVEDDAVMCAMQGLPLHLRIRENIIPAMMLTGVSTHPERRKRGYMRETLAHFMRLVREGGTPCIFQTPAFMPTFAAFGYYPATDTFHLSLEKAFRTQMPADVQTQDMRDGLVPLHALYQRVMRRYSGSVSRSIFDFYSKFRDYASDGAQCIVHDKGGHLLGYCVYYPSEAQVHVEECIVNDEDALSVLLDAMAFLAEGHALHVKLAPDSRPYKIGAAFEIRPQGAMAITDISALLKLVVNDPSFIFEVYDVVLRENSGIWDGAGNASDKRPHVRLESGRLAQFIGGYRSMRQLGEEGQAVLFDEVACHQLDAALPVQTCFVVDEY